MKPTCASSAQQPAIVCPDKKCMNTFLNRFSSFGTCLPRTLRAPSRYPPCLPLGMLPAARELLQAPPRLQPVGARHEAAAVPAAGAPLPGHRERTGLTAEPASRKQQACLRPRLELQAPRVKEVTMQRHQRRRTQRTNRRHTFLRPAAAARRCKPAQAAAGAGDAAGAGRSWKACALPLAATPADEQPVARLRKSMLLVKGKVCLSQRGLPLLDCVLARDEGFLKGSPASHSLGMACAPVD